MPGCPDHGSRLHPASPKQERLPARGTYGKRGGIVEAVFPYQGRPPEIREQGMQANLLTDARLGDAMGPGAASEPWQPSSPMPGLAPTFSVEPSPSDPAAASLRVDGSGNRHCFGAW